MQLHGKGDDYGYKGKIVVDAALSFDVDESANDHAKLILLVDDNNIIAQRKSIENFKSLTDFVGDDTESKEEKTEPLKHRKAQ